MKSVVGRARRHDRQAGAESVRDRRSFGPLGNREGRLLFLDLARGLAVVFMVCQHAQIMFAADAGEGSTIGELFLLLGTAPAAPVFMVAMGFLFGCSTRTGRRRGVLRGVALFALGYLLNLLRFTAPMYVAEAAGSRADADAVREVLGSPLQALLTVDILQLAGLSLIVIALIKPAVRDPRAVVAIALGVFAVAPLLWGIGGGQATAPLWGDGDTVAFPFLPWVGYPLLGLAYAQIVGRSRAAGRLMARTALVGLFVAVLGVALTLLGPAWSVVFSVGDYFHSGLPIHLAVAGFVFLWLAGLWWIAERVRDNAVFRYLTSLSRHLTPVYVIQWVVIGWLAIVFGVADLKPVVAAALAAPVLVASHLPALAWERGRRGSRGPHGAPGVVRTAAQDAADG